MLTVGSLFSGVGGFDLGLERAGMRVLWQVEFDKQAQSVLRHRWPDVALYDDVRNVGGHNLEPVDLICGGFPCQDLSVAGRRAGLAGDRSGLFYEFMRIVDELAPRWVLIENVPGLLSSNGGRDMGAVVGTLGELGYWWTYRVVDSQYFGVAQRRRRVFIVGHLGSPCPPEILLEPEGLPGDTPPGRETGKVAATLPASGAGTARTGNERTEADLLVTRPLDTTTGDYSRSDAAAYVAHTLTGNGFDASEDGTGRRTPIVPVAFDWQSGGDCRGLNPSEITNALHVGQTPAVVPLQEIGKRTGVSTDDPRAGIGIGDEGKPMYTLPAVAFHHSGYGASTGEVAQTLQASDARLSNQVQGVIEHAIPRRLTPTECEALQAFPRNWTRYGLDVPAMRLTRTRKLPGASMVGLWTCRACKTYQRARHTEAKSCMTCAADRSTWQEVELADGPRYRMMGNAITVTVAEWIGHRIVAHAHRTATRQEAAA